MPCPRPAKPGACSPSMEHVVQHCMNTYHKLSEITILTNSLGVPRCGCVLIVALIPCLSLSTRHVSQFYSRHHPRSGCKGTSRRTGYSWHRGRNTCVLLPHTALALMIRSFSSFIVLFVLVIVAMLSVAYRPLAVEDNLHTDDTELSVRQVVVLEEANQTIENLPPYEEPTPLAPAHFPR